MGFALWPTFLVPVLHHSHSFWHLFSLLCNFLFPQLFLPTLVWSWEPPTSVRPNLTFIDQWCLTSIPIPTCFQKSTPIWILWNPSSDPCHHLTLFCMSFSSPLAQILSLTHILYLHAFYLWNLPMMLHQILHAPHFPGPFDSKTPQRIVHTSLLHFFLFIFSYIHI